jgi:hypothetical protein
MLFFEEAIDSLLCWLAATLVGMDQSAMDGRKHWKGKTYRQVGLGKSGKSGGEKMKVCKSNKL